MRNRKILIGMAVALGALVATTQRPGASGHREALAILNDPCVDNAGVYAWVSPGSHDKLYLIAGYNGLSQAAPSSHQARLCDDVLYQFHIARGIGQLTDAITYQIILSSGAAKKVDPLTPSGGKELLMQLGRVQQTYEVWKVENGIRTQIGKDFAVAPTGQDDVDVAKKHISKLGTDGSQGRSWVGTQEDGFHLNEKGLVGTVNLAGLTAVGDGPGLSEDLFEPLNTSVNVIALEIPTMLLTGTGMPPAHPGVPGDDTLLGVWASASRRQVRVLGQTSDPRALNGWVQVGRAALPLVSAGLIGVQDRPKYLRTTPVTDVANFGSSFLSPLLVRDAESLGIYDAWGVPAAMVDALESGRLDILRAINLDDVPVIGSHHVPIAPGTTGDVIRVDMAIDSGFPNGRPLQRSAAANKGQADVSDILITLIVSGGAFAVGDGVDYNDKDYVKVFPFLALPHQDLNDAHRAPTQ